MAETIRFLAGKRFNYKANEVFRMSADVFTTMDLDSEVFMERLQGYIKRHRAEQVPRLRELKRYYLADNNIHYKAAQGDINRADNRISSDYAKYITTFMQGYILGNPVRYHHEDEGLLERIESFSKRNNIDYHNGLIETDLSIYGRAYELIYIDEVVDERVVKLDPQECFVVYDDSVENRSLFAVRHYQMDGNESEMDKYIEVYTAMGQFKYKATGTEGEWSLVEVTEGFFEGVTINEYANNEDRTGDYEAVLGMIDAYDLSQSSLANFQQDMSDAYLVIVGNPLTGTDEVGYDAEGNEVVKNGESHVLRDMRQSRILILDNNNDPAGPTPTAYYLKKEYDVAGSETYKQRLVNEILRFTFTPDTTDSNFSGTQSGEAMKYKLMGNDNLRKTKERLLTRGMMRRLRLVANVWGIKQAPYTAINETEIIFTPNLPANDKELVSMVKELYGIVSDETIFTLLQSITGVDAEDELQRLQEERGASQLQVDYTDLPAEVEDALVGDDDEPT